MIRESADLVATLEAVEGGWPSELRAKCRLASFASERSALEALFSDLDSLIDARAAFLKRPVDFPEAGLYSAKTREAVSRAADSGKPFAMITIGANEAKEHIKVVRVSGLPPAHAEDWAHVKRFVELHEEVLSFVTRWNHCAGELAIPQLESGVARLRSIETTANLARTAHTLATVHDGMLLRSAALVFEKVPAAELPSSAAQLAAVREHLQRHLIREQLSHAVSVLASLQETLAGTTGPVSSQLRELIGREHFGDRLEHHEGVLLQAQRPGLNPGSCAAAAPALLVDGVMAGEALIQRELRQEGVCLGNAGLQELQIAARVLHLPCEPEVHRLDLALALHVVRIDHVRPEAD